jgi:hypothetical protein
LSQGTSKLRPETIALRHEIRDFAIEKADSEWRQRYLRRLFDHHDWANDRYFESQLEPAFILLNEPGAPQRLGDCSSISGFGCKNQIRLRPSLLYGTHRLMRGGREYEEGRYRFVADVLMHEMIHQYQQEVSEKTEDSYHGHGPHFRDLANMIGADLGLPPVRDSKKRGNSADLPSCAYWPHNVRPVEYYLGAYVPPEDEEEIEILRPEPKPEDLKALLAKLKGLSRDDQFRLLEAWLPNLGADLVQILSQLFVHCWTLDPKTTEETLKKCTVAVPAFPGERQRQDRTMVGVAVAEKKETWMDWMPEGVPAPPLSSLLTREEIVAYPYVVPKLVRVRSAAFEKDAALADEPE